jgi:hypothetical protein
MTWKCHVDIGYKLWPNVSEEYLHRMAKFEVAWVEDPMIRNHYNQ